MIEEVHRFYSNLYTSEYSVNDSIICLEKVKTHVPKVDLILRELCDSEIQMVELDNKRTAAGKAPGQDGLTSSFSEFFWEDIKGMLFDAINDMRKERTLTPTMKQGFITLIPKHGNKIKDILSI